MNRLIIIAFCVLISNIAIGQITEIGLASFYADKFDGRITASGDIFDQKKMTAAHRTLPFGSKVKVTSFENSKTVIVIINDRGPFVNDRVIDLSKSAAKKLDFISKGVTKVKIEVLSIPKGKQVATKPYTPPSPPQKKAIGHNEDVSAGSISSQANEYYQVESTQITPQGFGIQVASYKEAANLMKRCDEIKKSTDKDIIIQVGNSGGDKVYRITLGSFASKEQASSYNQKIQGNFRGSFVISY